MQKTYEGLSLLPAISCQSQNLHTEVVQLVDDLLQTGEVVAADWAVLATVHNNQLPLAGRGTDLNHTTLQMTKHVKQTAGGCAAEVHVAETLPVTDGCLGAAEVRS